MKTSKRRFKRHRLFNKKCSLLLTVSTLRVCRRGFESPCIVMLMVIVPVFHACAQRNGFLRLPTLSFTNDKEHTLQTWRISVLYHGAESTLVCMFPRSGIMFIIMESFGDNFICLYNVLTLEIDAFISLGRQAGQIVLKNLIGGIGNQTENQCICISLKPSCHRQP